MMMRHYWVVLSVVLFAAAAHAADKPGKGKTEEPLYNEYVTKLQKVVKLPLSDQQVTRIRKITGNYQEEMRVRNDHVKYLQSKQKEIRELVQRMQDAAAANDKDKLRATVKEHRALLAAGPAGRIDDEVRKVLTEGQRKNWQKFEDDLDEQAVNNLMKSAGKKK